MSFCDAFTLPADPGHRILLALLVGVQLDLEDLGERHGIGQGAAPPGLAVDLRKFFRPFVRGFHWGQ